MVQSPPITTGDRKVKRVSEELFNQPNITKGIRGAICNAIEVVLCGYRLTLLEELADSTPDIYSSRVRKALTDIATVSDMALGGKCAIKCTLTPQAVNNITSKLITP